MGEQVETNHAESAAEQDTTVASQGLWRMSHLRTREEQSTRLGLLARKEHRPCSLPFLPGV